MSSGMLRRLVLVLALVVGALPVWPWATDARAAQHSVLQGEAMTKRPSAGRLVRDRSAAGGRALLLRSGASATARFSGAATGLELRVRAVGCTRTVRVLVRVNGRRMLRRRVRTGSWRVLRTSRAVGGGPHVLTVSLLRDRRPRRGCDRAVKIDHARITRPARPGAPRDRKSVV